MNYNQNDPVYKNTKLGFSNKYTLFSDGCYVFCLAYILGIDVLECNEKLKSAGAFMANSEGDVCLLNHAKIQLAFPNRVVSVAKYDTYDNDACLEAIEKNGACIVKVDYDGSNSTTMDTHFVTFIGNKKLFDSLGGKEKPTSTYPILRGLRVITLKDEVTTEMYKGYDLGNSDSMKIAVDKLVDIMSGVYITSEEHQRIINELDSKSTEQATKYAEEKRLLTENIRILEDLHKQDLSWADIADDYQKKLKGIVDLFETVNIKLAVESDVAVLVGTLHDYIANAEADRAFVTGVLSDTSLGSPEAVVEALQQSKLNEKTIIELEKQITKLRADITALKNKQPTLYQFIINKYFK